MQTVSELVLTRNQLIQIARTREDRDFLTAHPAALPHHH